MGGSRGDLCVAGQMCVALHAWVRPCSTWPEQPQALRWAVTHWHSYQTRLIGLCLCTSVQQTFGPRTSPRKCAHFFPSSLRACLMLACLSYLLTHVCLFFFQSPASLLCREKLSGILVLFLNANLLATRSCTLATAWPSFSPHISAVMMLRGCNTQKHKRFGKQARAPRAHAFPAEIPCVELIKDGPIANPV